jgi:hypothetical protein
LSRHTWAGSASDAPPGPQVTALAVSLGTQSTQFVAKAAERICLVLSGLDPCPDEPGAQARGGAERMNTHGESDARADRVSNAGLLQLVRYRLNRSWCSGCLGKLAVQRHACQVLRDQLPVVFDRAGADDAPAMDQLQIQSAPVIWINQQDAVGIPAQRAERAPVDQIDEEQPELDLPVRALRDRLLGWAQAGVKAPLGPGCEPGQIQPLHRLGQLVRPAARCQVSGAGHSGTQGAVQVKGGKPLASGILDDLVQRWRIGGAVPGVSEQSG